MATQPLFDPSRPPERDMLADTLGAAMPLWDAVIGLACKRSPQLIETWNFAGPKVGWSLRLIESARILVYLTPEQGRFRVGLVLGGKAVATARAAGRLTVAASIVEAAPKYAEGHGVRFHVASQADLAAVEELLDIKCAASDRPTRRGKQA